MPILRNIRLDEVSLVDKGANQHARIKLIKRDTDDMQTVHQDVAKAAMPLQHMIFGPASQKIVDDALARMRGTPGLKPQAAHAQAFSNAEGSDQATAIAEERRFKTSGMQKRRQGSDLGHEMMVEKAEAFRKSEAEAGRHVTHEQAFVAVYERPENVALRRALRGGA